MLNETGLREQNANLQQRLQQLGSQGQARFEQLAAALQTQPQEASDDAHAAVLSYKRALPFLETANSLIESLAKPSPSEDDDEWRDQLLFRLAEVLEIGADLIAEGEAHLQRSTRV